MAVCGPNSEGFANTQAALCPTFSPAVDENDAPLMPDYRTDGFISASATFTETGALAYSLLRSRSAKRVAVQLHPDDGQ